MISPMICLGDGQREDDTIRPDGRQGKKRKEKKTKEKKRKEKKRKKRK